MKLGRIQVETADGPIARLVAVHPEEARIVDLATAERLRLEARGATTSAARQLATALFPGSMKQAIALGSTLLEAIHTAVNARGADASFPIEGQVWLAAVDPPVLRDGITFEQHLLNYHAQIGHQMNPLHYEIPGYYKGSTSRLFGHDAEIPWPSYTRMMDYELEIGFVVGKTGHDLTPDEAVKHLFGVTIFNDFSARDIQRREMLLGMGPTKSKDFAYGVGPWITTVDELQLNNLEMIVRINGEERSRGSSSGMMWTPSELLAYISMGDMLQPGDLIGSGTVGWGSGLEQERYLEPGDSIETEIVGVGVLRNHLGQPEPSVWMPTHRQPKAKVPSV